MRGINTKIIVKSFSLVFLTYLIIGAFLPRVGNAVTYATWNGSDCTASITLSNGNLTLTQTADANTRGCRSTIGKSSGKWYWEVHADNIDNLLFWDVGVASSTADLTAASGNGLWIYLGGQGGFSECENTQTGGMGNVALNDVIGVALDMDNHTVDIYKNNSHLFQCTTVGGGGSVYASWQGSKTNNAVTANFGATAQTYTPPAGYCAALADTCPVAGASNPFWQIFWSFWW